jgi:sulfonate transport system substrate-binding protein
MGALINGQVGCILAKTNALEKNNLEGDVQGFLYGQGLRDALVTNNLDVILTSEANFVTLLGGKTPFPCKIVATLGSAGRIGIMIKPDSTLQNVADLKGKVILAPFGTSAHYPAVKWATDAGLTPGKDIEIRNSQAAEARQALLRGDVDGIALWDPYIAQMLEEKQVRLLVSKTDFWTTTVVSESFYNKNKDALVDFIIALKEALFYMANHQNEADQWLSETMKVDAKLIHEGSKHNVNYNAKNIESVSAAPNEALITVLEAIAGFNLASGLSKTQPDIRANVDSGLARLADKKFRERGAYDPGTVKVK